jgi:pyruvate ferredoxin oxidoreductase gamma subunit
MKKNKNLGVRWHSRAGHGAITAANALCEIVAAYTDLSAQAFPDFGAEKRGAPVVVYNRFSLEEIRENHHVQRPDIVVFLDTSLINPDELSYEDILEGIQEEGNVIINTHQEKTQFSQKFSGKVFHVDATEISETEIGKNIPNVPMLGALLKVSGLMSVEAFLPALEKFLAKGLPPKIVEGNLIALKRGFEEVKEV